ncbi:hypothetical protein GALMADRAFT_73470 [Galerina marginata CBS 339.88]|uniref:Uncharacterized protein n=1 Tax=Galerina marginata (strain CBS 339.88) TaxID=685588 RepID=A0A067SNY9_GALM3|nr:hypothetical protein GALMADRAFT_73470 [Galerina marginata CBS 339.88]
MPAIRAAEIDNNRTLYDIVHGCCVTLFACTWLSIHPNICAPSDSDWTSRRRRLKTMLCALIVPELVLVWALRQRTSAKKIAEKQKEKKWTLYHGFFISMGGFNLFCDGKHIPLSLKRLEQLEECGWIAWPGISEQEIKDKSKGDFLSKGIAVSQTVWFVVQCVARFEQGLAVTELELVTMAFVILNVALYWAWWDKPLDVRCPVDVKIKEGITLPQVEDLFYRDDTKSDPPNSRSRLRLPSFLILKLSTEKGVQLTYANQNFFLRKFMTFIHPKGPHGCLHRMIISLARPFSDMLSSTEIPRGANCVPTFYAPSGDSKSDEYSIALGLGFAILFGLSHCVGIWVNLSFPTEIEQDIWRVTAIAITAAPLAFQLLGGLVLALGSPEPERPWSGVFVYGCLVIWYLILITYIFSRFVLLVLPLISMRALPGSAFDDISWTKFLPHI